MRKKITLTNLDKVDFQEYISKDSLQEIVVDLADLEDGVVIVPDEGYEGIKSVTILNKK